LRLTKRYNSRVIRPRLCQRDGLSLTQYTYLVPCDMSIVTKDKLAVIIREKIEAET